MTKAIKRTERGWAGHFICADRCLFRRNTLLEYDDIKIVVSTVGLMQKIDLKSDFHFSTSREFDEIGVNRHFETMAFHANKNNLRYHDIDVQRGVVFEAPWSIAEVDADDKANDMHETVVAEITKRMEAQDDFKEP